MKKVLSTFAIIVLGLQLFAQDTFTEVLNLSEKKLGKCIVVSWGQSEWRPDTKNGTGITPDLSMVNLKKIALVAYTLYAPESRDYSGGYQFLTETGINYFADKLYENSIVAMKSAFEKGGIELITKDDMTDKQKSILTDTQGDTWLKDLDKENNKLENAYKKVEEKGVKVGTSVEGYKNWTIARGLPIFWDINMIAKIADALEVDAVLVINNQVSPEKKSLVFNNSMLTLIGRNPIPKVEGKIYPGLSYATGMCYAQTVLNIDGGLDLAILKKGEVESEYFQDYDKLMGLTVDKMLQNIELNTQKSKERRLKQKK